MLCRKAHIWENNKCAKCENKRLRDALESLLSEEYDTRDPDIIHMRRIVEKALKGE